MSVLHESPKVDPPYAPLERGRHVIGEARIVLEIAQDTPASRLVEVLRAARDAGARTVDLIVASNERVELPAYPDPDHAADFEHRLRGLDAAQRAMVAATEIEGLITLCPGAHKVVTAVQVISQPSGQWRTTALTLTLTDEGEPLEVPTDATWKDLHHDQEVTVP